MPDVTPDALADYFTAHEEQRRQENRGTFPGLERQLTAYLAEHAGDPHLGNLLARMIWEAAIVAFGRGIWQAGGSVKDDLPGPEVLWDTMHYVREFDDACPAWRVFDGRDEEEAQ